MRHVVVHRPRIHYPRIHYPRVYRAPRIGIIATPVWALTIITATMIYAVVWIIAAATIGVVMAAVWLYQTGERHWHDRHDPSA